MSSIEHFVFILEGGLRRQDRTWSTYCLLVQIQSKSLMLQSVPSVEKMAHSVCVCLSITLPIGIDELPTAHPGKSATPTAARAGLAAIEAARTSDV